MSKEFLQYLSYYIFFSLIWQILKCFSIQLIINILNKYYRQIITYHHYQVYTFICISFLISADIALSRWILSQDTFKIQTVIDRGLVIPKDSLKKLDNGFRRLTWVTIKICILVSTMPWNLRKSYVKSNPFFRSL